MADPQTGERIVQFDGVEHHFPADFTDAEVQQALGGSKPPASTAQSFLSEAVGRLKGLGNAIGSWTAPGRYYSDTGELLPKQFDAQGKPSQPTGSRGMGDYVAAHPVREGASLLASAVPAAQPAAPALLRKAVAVATHPIAGAAIGGYEGYKRGGVIRGIEGAAVGAGLGKMLQRYAASAGPETAADLGKAQSIGSEASPIWDAIPEAQARGSARQLVLTPEQAQAEQIRLAQLARQARINGLSSASGGKWVPKGIAPQ